MVHYESNVRAPPSSRRLERDALLSPRALDVVTPGLLAAAVTLPQPERACLRSMAINLYGKCLIMHFDIKGIKMESIKEVVKGSKGTAAPVAAQFLIHRCQQ